MKLSSKFNENEVPYKTLEQFGLTREMVDDLPMRVLEDIYAGRRSPVLPIQVTGDNGETVKSRTRFSLIRLDNGETDVVFYPVLKTSPLEKYSEAQQKQLLAGNTIIADVELADGKHSKAFVQIDAGTKQVMSAPTPVIARNLQVIAKELHLGSAEVRSIQNGLPLTFVVEDDPVTLGIDLNARTGIRLSDGDEQKWREQTHREWEKYTFGINGCWVMDDDGNLDYVKEENYTEELWNEQKKQGQRNAALSLHK